MDEHVDDLPVEDEWTLFEQLGRRAAADLRTAPPEEGLRAVERTVHRRRATAAVAGGALLAVTVVGWFAMTGTRHDEPGDGPVTPPPTSPVTLTTTVAPLPKGEPGTWRSIPDAEIAPEFARAAVWTGSEAIVLGWRGTPEAPVADVVAYDVRSDTWRPLGDAPDAFADRTVLIPAPAWTGSEMLVAGSDGEVFSYGPSNDRWTTRAPAPVSAELSTTGTALGISPAGVVARSVAGWWWYDETTNEWTSISSPGSGFEQAQVGSLNATTMAAWSNANSKIRLAVLDTSLRTWASVIEVEGPPTGRGPTNCRPVDAMVACWSERAGTLDGIVVDPSVGTIGTFRLGNHSNMFNVDGIPWFTHAWKLLLPATQTWEELPELDGVDGFGAGVWTGSELVFFGGEDAETGQPLLSAAAYTPLETTGAGGGG